jgi:hypothetical protein
MVPWEDQENAWKRFCDEIELDLVGAEEIVDQV